jgi:hypothetical protein
MSGFAHQFIKDTDTSQTQHFYYIITFKVKCFDSIESSSGLLENRSNVSIFIVHSGIPKFGTVDIKVHVSETSLYVQ